MDVIEINVYSTAFTITRHINNRILPIEKVNNLTKDELNKIIIERKYYYLDKGFEVRVILI